MIQLEPIYAFSPPHRLSRIFHSPERYIGIILENVKKIFLTENKVYGDDPKSYDKAISDIDSEEWLEVMKSEINSIHSNQV